MQWDELFPLLKNSSYGYYRPHGWFKEKTIILYAVNKILKLSRVLIKSTEN